MTTRDDFLQQVVERFRHGVEAVSERKVLFIFGTRPEAIKLARVIHELRAHTGIRPIVCVTAQHREMLDQVLKIFSIRPDYDLDIMAAGQTLPQSTSRILMKLEPVLAEVRPDMIFVQGDTTTTFCGALAGFYADIPVAHVEAGLRTGDIRQPFPEEMNRVLVSRLSTLHFAATAAARNNLLADGVAPAQIHVTGNTGIDAVLHIRDQLDEGQLESREWDFLNSAKKLLLVTAHRRESFGAGFDTICMALRQIAEQNDVQIVYPVHLNPNVRRPVQEHLQGHRDIVLLEPLNYVDFVDLMRRAYLILTDSGGIQEEAPSFGKPVLVMREKTERPEAVEAGTSTLVGVETERIAKAVTRLLTDEGEYRRRARIHNPYGDGHASERIASVILDGFNADLASTARLRPIRRIEPAVSSIDPGGYRSG
jgi:UDP-N-acetylglucosamine 2-epimerase (non-hydrolysing)